MQSGFGFKCVLVGATAIGVVLGSVAQAQTPLPRNFYVFGDATSATGNDLWVWDPYFGYRSADGPSGRYYQSGFEGRFSNGPSWVERLGYQLGLAPNLGSLQGPYQGFSGQYQGYSFAHSRGELAPQASASAQLSRFPEIRHSASAQVNLYANQVQAGSIKTSANDLYSYWFNAYSPRVRPQFMISNYNDRPTPEAVVSASTDTLQKIRAIANPGASILALGSLRTTQYTWVDPGSNLSSYYSSLDGYAIALNENLKRLATSSANTTTLARIHYVDVPGLIDNIKANRERYGFLNVGSTSISEQICIAPNDCRVVYRPSVGDWYTVKGILQGDFPGTNNVVPSENPDQYLWHSQAQGTLTGRGQDILAYYVASTLGGVYAWDQFRAVGSGTGAVATSAVATASARTGSAGFAQSMLGFSQVQSANGAKVFALGFGEDQLGPIGLSQARGGSLQLIGSSVPLTSRLTVGGASFTDRSRDSSLDLNVRGSGGTGFATFSLGQDFDLNVMASSQRRTLNTNRPITFDYVGGVARARTKVRLDVAQVSLGKMFDVKGVKVGPVASAASVTERWGETRETGVPEWLAANRAARQARSTAVNLGLAADWGMTDKSGGKWSLSAKAGRIEADAGAPVAMVAPSQTLAEALEQEKGSANFATIVAGREAENGLSFGLEAGIAQTNERQVEAVRGRVALRF